MRCLLLTTMWLVGLFATMMTAHASSFTLDDIEFWVGEGENQVGLAIDWNGDDLNLPNAAPSLAWGYRWDGTATAEDALRDVLAADPRLFGKLAGAGGLGTAVLGLGYDANNDGMFAVNPAEPFDPTTGLSLSTAETFANSADSADAYEEGFNFNLVDPSNQGFWHFTTTASPAASAWTSSIAGVSASQLADGTFVGFAFSPSFDFAGAFPNELAAASPPILTGDFNNDQAVDAADYIVIRDGLSTPEDFATWRANFGTNLPASALPTVAGSIPEPSSLALVGFAISLAFHSRNSRLGKTS